MEIEHVHAVQIKTITAFQQAIRYGKDKICGEITVNFLKYIYMYMLPSIYMYVHVATCTQDGKGHKFSIHTAFWLVT